MPLNFRGRNGNTTNGAGPHRARGLYRYSPSNGKLIFLIKIEITCLWSSENQYFSSHYYLGHRKFETGEPELFLFGDLQDLNYLSPKPVKVELRAS